MRTTIGQVIVNDTLPEDLRDYNRVMTKGAADNVLEEVARRYPERYREVSHAMMQRGRHAAFEEGTTLRLSDLISPIDKTESLAHVTKQERAIDADRTSTPDQKSDAKEELYSAIHEYLKGATYDETLKRENPLALQVLAKARGSKDQLTSLMTTPGMYQDSNGRTIPMFIRKSYAEGLDPHEYYAASYGARLGVVSTKSGTRQAGYLGKLMAAAAVDSVVTQDDCGTPYGVPVATDDNDNVGSVLARDTGGIPAGTVLTQSVLAKLKPDNKEIMVRSPMTCGTHKGVCKQCVGIRESGKFAPIGYNIGLNASSALAEQLAQGSLNLKHSGKKYKGTGDDFSGFDVVKNLATIPSNAPNSATVSELEGKVDSIEEAPQGGSIVTIEGQPHYVSPDMAVRVKVGDNVEAGDALSGGIVNPADVVRLKGIGEGRRYFAGRMTKAFRDSGYGTNRRNVEVLARSLINHVQIDDADAAGQHLQGDVVTYNSWQHGYKPRRDAQTLAPKKAIGRYLEQPVMHYTPGTRVTKSVAQKMGEFGVESVLAHEQPVGISPAMQSVTNVPEFGDDWMARLGSSYLQKRLLEDVHRGAESNVHGLNPLPGIAKGTEFGQQKGKAFTY
jgi:DNA-directed RNA polymerase subunit beta'